MNYKIIALYSCDTVDTYHEMPRSRNRGGDSSAFSSMESKFDSTSTLLSPPQPRVNRSLYDRERPQSAPGFSTNSTSHNTNDTLRVRTGSEDSSSSDDGTVIELSDFMRSIQRAVKTSAVFQQSGESKKRYLKSLEKFLPGPRALKLKAEIRHLNIESGDYAEINKLTQELEKVLDDVAGRFVRFTQDSDRDSLARFEFYVLHSSALTKQAISYFDKTYTADPSSKEKLERHLHKMFEIVIPSFWRSNPKIFGLSVFKNEDWDGLISTVVGTVANTLKVGGKSVVEFPADAYVSEATKVYKEMDKRLSDYASHINQILDTVEELPSLFQPSYLEEVSKKLGLDVGGEDISSIDLFREYVKKVDEADQRFNPRSASLFKWCYLMMKLLVFAPLNNFIKGQATKEEETIWGTLMAIFDTYLDDISDNVQSKVLVDKFIQIPNLVQNRAASEARLQEIEAELGRYMQGIFLPYFRAAFGLYEKIHSQIVYGAKGNSIPQESKEQIGSLLETLRMQVDELMGVMTYSVDLNTKGELQPFDKMVRSLAPNMMTQILFSKQMISLQIHGDTQVRAFINENMTEFYKAFRKIEEIYHLGNCLASDQREIEERDNTNPFFWFAAESVKDRGKYYTGTYKRVVEKIAKISEGEGFSENCKIDQFEDLLTYGELDTPKDRLLKIRVAKYIVAETSNRDVYFSKVEDAHRQLVKILDGLKKKIKVDMRFHEETKGSDLPLDKKGVLFLKALDKMAENADWFVTNYAIASNIKGMS